MRFLRSENRHASARPLAGFGCGLALLACCLTASLSLRAGPPAPSPQTPGNEALDSFQNEARESVEHTNHQAGKQAYLEKCASCHGARGQGGDGYQRSLAGDWPLGQLTEYIATNMPEGDPEGCVGEEAEQVAAYIFDAFYSPIAQARNRPPRRELSRLTVRQYQQTIADLVQTFRPRPAPASAAGLTQQIYRGGSAQESRLLEKRVAPMVDYRSSESPSLTSEMLFPAMSAEEQELAEQIANYSADEEADNQPKKPRWQLEQEKLQLERERQERGRLLLRWTGALRADRTGEHELIVASNAAFQLNFNGQRKLIDARVLSGDQDTRQATVQLIEGRSYPIELLVNRLAEPEVQVRLSWIPPGGTQQPIPPRYLTPAWRPPVTLATTRFPPDDRSTGYVRGASVSSAWVDAATRASLGVAREVARNLPQLLKLKGDLNPSPGKAREFAAAFAERAFRRPLDENERQAFVDKWFDAYADGQEATQMSVLAVLSSPRFLYPELGTTGAAVDYQNASRLALALWDSLPDVKLLRAAEQGKLRTRAQIAQQAERMLDDPRTRSKLTEFFRTWLHIERDHELARDQRTFPDFQPQVADDMRTSLEMFLNQVAWQGDSDFRQLFLSADLYVNKNLASFLGIEYSDTQQGFWRISPSSQERAGVVTHPYLVATLAYSRETSPIHRGVFLARNILGRTLRPPPEAVAPLPPNLKPDLTTRERVALQTSPTACQGCHVMINHLGFTLERFDAVGRRRETEAGQPVDTSGFYIGLDGRETRFNGARELAEFLARSDDVYRAFAIQLMEHTSKQPAPAHGPGTIQRLLDVLQQSEYSIQQLLVEAAVIATLPE